MVTAAKVLIHENKKNISKLSKVRTLSILSLPIMDRRNVSLNDVGMEI